MYSLFETNPFLAKNSPVASLPKHGNTVRIPDRNTGPEVTLILIRGGALKFRHR